MNWQRLNVQAAATYLRDRIASGADDIQTKAVYEGLLDVLDPTRRTARVRREAAESAKAAVGVQAARDRRTRIERRRAGHERRRASLSPPGNVERRAVGERRTRDRRS